MRLGLWLCGHSTFKTPDWLSSLLQINLVHDRDVQIRVHVWSDDHALQKGCAEEMHPSQEKTHTLKSGLCLSFQIVCCTIYSSCTLGCVNKKKESKPHLKLNKLLIILIKIISSHCHSSWAAFSAKRLQASAVRSLTAFFIHPGDRERAMGTICHPGATHWEAERESLWKCHLEKKIHNNTPETCSERDCEHVEHEKERDSLKRAQRKQRHTLKLWHIRRHSPTTP